MVRRNGSAPNAPSVMLFSRIGKLIPKPVGRENTPVIVEQYFQGNCFNLYLMFISLKKKKWSNFYDTSIYSFIVVI